MYYKTVHDFGSGSASVQGGATLSSKIALGHVVVSMCHLSAGVLAALQPAEGGQGM